MWRLALLRHLRAVLKRTLHPGLRQGPGQPRRRVAADAAPVARHHARRRLLAHRPLIGVQSGQVVGIPSSEGVTGDIPPLPWYGLVSTLA